MHKSSSQYDIAIAGAGASGMMAACAAARNGARVCLIEANGRVGKKILETGNGRCNLSHMPIDGTEYHGTGADRIGGFLARFGADATLEFFRELGLLTRERDGYIYPYSETASAVLDVLRYAVCDLGVDVYTDRRISAIEAAEGGFSVSDICAGKVILCMGGAADPASGSDGSGYDLARALGLHVIDPLPALVKIRTSDIQSMAVTAGVRAKGSISVMTDRLIASDTGEIQFTKDGLSGIPVFNVSRYISRAVAGGQKVRAVLDLMPEMSADEIYAYVSDLAGSEHSRTHSVEEMLSGILHKKINIFILKRLGISPAAHVGELSPDHIRRYASAIKELEYEVESTYGFDQAQVTCGGVDFAEVDDDLECTRVSGLYLAGEILDVDGPCGGYNLQWAWTSGYIAGSAAAKC